MSSLPERPEQQSNNHPNLADDDDFIWLEELKSPTVLDWLQQQNLRTARAFAENPRFQQLESQILTLLNQDTQIPWVTQYGDYYYNFWQDSSHPRGLWRRTTLAEYRQSQPAWETVIDIDALGKTEGTDWVFQGAQPLTPAYRRCLVKLSPDGGDAVTVREFDLVGKTFISNGFSLPVAKSMVSWIDQDTLFVATDFGAGSLTQSGYPRMAKRWRRGTPLGNAEMVYQGAPGDMSVFAYHNPTPGFERDFIQRTVDFFHRECFYLSPDNRQIKIDIPADADAGCHRQWLLIHLRSEWRLGDQTYSSGTLLAADFDAYLAGSREVTALFVPDARTALSTYTTTRSHVILNIMSDVTNRLEIVTPQADNRWQRRLLCPPGSLSSSYAAGINFHSDDFMLTQTGFLQPNSLYLGNLGPQDDHPGPQTLELLKQAPDDFDSSRYQVRQHFATSVDGTRVPYFEISAKDLRLDGNNPTLLYGYGGFEISLLPFYLGSNGLSWLERGGVYVVANIRGGGEYGPAWHQSALKQHRPRAYEDFAAVARALSARQVTSAARLGIRGGSNGGLLVGNMLTQYPELFGAVVCEVPLLDMRRYTRLSAGASWIAEYGDPDQPEQWDFIRTFSPYHNLKAQTPYPPVLFYTATSDDRVNPAHARKMMARMRQLGYQQAWFYENTEGGHSAAADKQQAAFHAALVSEFLWHHLTAPG